MKQKISKEVSVLCIDEYSGDELIAKIKELQNEYGEIKFGLEYSSYSDDKYIAVYQVREETDKEFEERMYALKADEARKVRNEQAEFRRLSAIYNKENKNET